MRPALSFLIHGTLIAGLAFAAAPEPVTLSPAEADAWVRYTVPLPKIIRVTARVSLPAADIAVLTPDRPEPLVAQAARELREALGREQTSTEKPAAFTLTLRQGGPEAEILKGRKYPDQAYRILPAEDGSGLLLVGLAPHGVYYAAKTLQQLIRPKTAPAAVELPVLEVTDWPDLEDRGLWGSDAFLHLRWLSDRKMNYMEQIAAHRVVARGRHTSDLNHPKKLMVDDGPAYGINPVPVVLHLEQLAGRGLFDVYPQLKGQGDCAEGAVCYSNPLFVDVLADWIAGYAAMPGVAEVDVWMAENLHGKPGCRCPACRPQDRSVLEAAVIVRAWEKARQRAPGVGIRILTSEATEDSNELVFRSLPPEVKIWYYHSLFTYNAGERPMVRPYLADMARTGRWAGVCFSLAPGTSMAQPFSGAAFAHYRMNEFVDKKMSGILGYATPRVYSARFNVEAAAEWTWNAKGRSPREFALSWAVRNGLDDPELFAEWSETLGPVAWDVYGSEWPSGDRRNAGGHVAEQLRKGELRELGFILWSVYPCPWGDIKSPQQLGEDVARARAAVALAKRMGLPEFLEESLVVQGYINSLEALWELRGIVTPKGVADENRDAARRWFRAYVDSLGQARDALPRWRQALPRGSDTTNIVEASRKMIGESIQEMTAVARDLGLAP